MLFQCSPEITINSCLVILPGHELIVSGLKYGQLIDRMVDCAMKAYQEKERNSFAFHSDILSGVQLGGAKGAKGGKLKL